MRVVIPERFQNEYVSEPAISHKSSVIGGVANNFLLDGHWASSAARESFSMRAKVNFIAWISAFTWGVNPTFVSLAVK